MKKPPSRDERLMEWLQRKNRLYAPLIQPVCGVGFILALATNHPEYCTALAMLFIGSLSAGKK
jgi:hypothetical protein